MPDTPKDKDLEETKRIMERLVKTPPTPHDSDKAKKSQEQRKRTTPAKVSPSSSAKQ